MKSAWLIAAVLASVVAGAGGGYIASQQAGQQQPAPNKVEVAALDLDGGTDHSSDLRKQADEISRLRTELGSLMVRVESAEKANGETAALKAQIKELSTKLETLKASGGTVAGSDGTGAAPIAAPNANTPEFDAAVEAAIEKREAAQRAERDAERQKQMEDWANQRNKTIVDKLATDLSLTEVQKTNIETILKDQDAKRAEVMQRGRAARDNGEEFDWGAEMGTVSTAAVEAVRAELSSAQLTTFNELLGDSNSLDALAGRQGRFGPGGMPGGGRGRGN
jgi:DNA repair exonuclease SbcCD ATPase subunit